MGSINDNQYILSMSPDALLNWLTDNFTVELPSEVISVEDMNNAARLLLKLTEMYSYINTLLASAKLQKRQCSREKNKEDKQTVKAYEDAVDRCEMIEKMAEIVKQQYAAVSRAVTIHMDNNVELRMNSSGSLNER